MATIKSIDLILNEMILKDLNFYRVYDSDGKSLLTSQSNKDVTAAEAVKQLREYLESIEGIVIITISSVASDEIAAGGKRGHVYKYQVKIGSSNGSVQTVSGPSEPAANINTVFREMEEKFNAKLDKMQADYLHKLEVDQLKREINELKENDSFKEMGLQMLAQFFNNGTPGPIAGVTNEKTAAPGIGAPEDQTERTQRLQSCIKKIASVDKNYLEHFEILSNLAINQPLIYWGAIEKLKEY